MSTTETSSGLSRMQGARRATGHAPLREGGGAAMNGMSMPGKRQAAGAATGGVLRGAVAATALHTKLHPGHRQINPFADGPCGSMHRQSPAVLPPPPFSSTPKSRPRSCLLPGGTPLPEGGECLRTLHFPTAAPQSHQHHPCPPNSTKNRIQGAFQPPPETFPAGNGKPVNRIPAAKPERT